MSSTAPHPHPRLNHFLTDPLQQARCLSVINGLHRARSPAEVLHGLCSATEAMGAAASIYTTLIPEGADGVSSFSLHACDPVYVVAQEQLGPFLEHPWMRFARQHGITATDRQVMPADDGEKQQLELAARSGFHSCLIVSAAAGVERGRVDVLWLGSDGFGDFDHETAALCRTVCRTLLAELQAWHTEYLDAFLRRSAALDAADVELLRLEREGMSTKRIASRTGQSSASVDSRFQRLNARLGCLSRAESARRAAEYGVFDVSD